MAFVSNMDDEKNQNNPSQGAVSPVGGGGSVHLSPQSAVPSSGGSGTNVGPSPTPGAGGQFGSLNQYLTANQGQAEPLAGKLTTGIGNQYKSLEGQNTSTLNDINSQVSANAIPNANDLIAQEAANPVSFASNASNIPSFQKLLTASYGGPASAEGTNQYQSQQAAINKAISQGQTATKTEAGREGLLQQNETTPTTGVTALNSAILSQSPAALSSVEKAYDPFSNLLTGLSGGAADVNKNISKTQGDIALANATANKQIADQMSGLNTQVKNENTNAFNAANTNYNNLMGAFNKIAPPDQALLDAVNKAHAVGAVAGGDASANAALKAAMANNPGASAFTPDQLAQLGITPDQMNQLLAAQNNLETSKFISSGNAGNGSAWTQALEAPLQNWLTAVAPTQSNFAGATSDEIARGNALNSISGTNQFVAPTPGPAYVTPTFDVNGALTALNSGVAQNNLSTQQQADQVAANQQKQHEESKQHGFFNALKNDIANPVDTISAAFNPFSWGSNLINLATGQPIKGTDMGQKYIGIKAGS